ncbi:hypothetical protein GTA51_04805 [Desulfovibrio aerotolerans]|uniref:Uncharacterized protein n=1 Tax=Solidesulfovibrio aerotolerans TaxID=295255 RepID=A0A7C9J7X4_9BACT|nr:hypothetical protein [Solidesulfovibrio aerotolerans]MYL82458.1 hypothetical protein [Solidesulfovibrio aerotolerans]
MPANKETTKRINVYLTIAQHNAISRFVKTNGVSLSSLYSMMTDSFLSNETNHSNTWILSPDSKPLTKITPTDKSCITTEQLTEIINDNTRDDYAMEIASVWNLFNNSLIE